MSENQQSGTEMANGDLSYKYQRLRERLRHAVTSGELAGKLPGERELARRYAANAKTINKALNDLAMEGLVLRHVGRGTFVADNDASSPKPTATSRNFLWLAPGRVDDPDLDNMFGMTRTLLAGRGHSIERCVTELDGSGELPEATLTPRAMRQIDGAVIYAARPSRGLLANLRRRHLSVVLVNNHHDEIRLPTVLCDYAHAGFTICEQCILLGHRRIQVVLRPHSLPAASAVDRGYRAAMAHYGLAALPCLLGSSELDLPHLTSGEDRPTALICLSGALGRKVCEQVGRPGLNVPSDLSIGVVGEPSETVAQACNLSAYEVDAGRILHWAADLILQGWSNQSPSLVIVPGKFVDRGSIVPPPGSSAAKPPQPISDATI